MRMKNSVSNGADVADEMDHAQPAGLQRVGVRADHLGQLVAAGVLEHADGHELVVWPVHFAEVGLAHAQLFAQSARGRSRRPATATCSVVVLMPVPNAPVVSRARNMKPPKPQPTSTKRCRRGLSRSLRHTWSILLRWASSRLARAFAPVGAGVHHQRLVEPQAIERLAQPVVRPRIDLRLGGVAVGGAPLHQVVLDAVERVEPQVEARAHGRRHGRSQVAPHIDLLVEIAFHQPEMAAREGRHQRPIGAKRQRESRLARAGAVLLATGQSHCERDPGACAQRVDDGLQRKVHEAGSAV